MNGSIEVKLYGRKVTVMGGPYRDKPNGVRGVKLAQEIDAPADVVLDIPDFGVPTFRALNDPLYKTLDILEQDGVVYVGCMGGIGRTGMFIALLMKTIGVIKFNRDRDSWWGRVKWFFGKYPSTVLNGEMIYTPVEFVREYYLAHAVETSAQAQLVDSYDPDPMLDARERYKALAED